MGEIKQTNFRVDQEKADVFRAYCEANGINQAVGFERMLEALELQQAKEAIPSRETEISEFERCLHHLQAAYLTSLELSEQAEARVRDEFSRQITSKDKAIENYQEQLQTEKEKNAALSETQLKLMEAQQIAAEERAKLVAKDEELALLQKQNEKQLADKDNIIEMLTEKLAAADAKAKSYDSLKTHFDAQMVSLKEAQATIKDMERDHEIALERAAREAEKSLEAAVATTKAQGDAQISKLKDDLQEAKVKAAENLRAAEEKAHESDKAAAAEIRKLEQDNARLREQLIELRAKVPEN